MPTSNAEAAQELKDLILDNRLTSKSVANAMTSSPFRTPFNPYYG